MKRKESSEKKLNEGEKSTEGKAIAYEIRMKRKVNTYSKG